MRLKKLVPAGCGSVMIVALNIGVNCPATIAIGDEPVIQENSSSSETRGPLGGVPPSPHPVRAKQPDGTPIKIWFEGSPFLNWYEDEQGFTVVRHNKTYVYARRGPNGDLVPDRNLIVGKANPAKAGLTTGIRPTQEAMERAQRRIESPSPKSRKGASFRSLPHGAYTDVTSEFVGALDAGEHQIEPQSTTAAKPKKNSLPGKTVQYRQADGETVDLLDQGGWMTDVDGFAVVLLGPNYVYAVRNSQGTLLPIPGLLVGQADPSKSGLQKNPTTRAGIANSGDGQTQ
jgi:hypothetical protein